MNQVFEVESPAAPQQPHDFLGSSPHKGTCCSSPLGILGTPCKGVLCARSASHVIGSAIRGRAPASSATTASSPFLSCCLLPAVQNGPTAVPYPGWAEQDSVMSQRFSGSSERSMQADAVGAGQVARTRLRAQPQNTQKSGGSGEKQKQKKRRRRPNAHRVL